MIIIFIKQMRERRGLSQLEVSKQLNISQSAISQYEKSKREPSIEILIKLADLFGCTIDELVRGEKE